MAISELQIDGVNFWGKVLSVICSVCIVLFLSHTVLSQTTRKWYEHELGDNICHLGEETFALKEET